jgi:hypothetical protein
MARTSGVRFGSRTSIVLWRNIDLCSIEVITLRYDRATDTTTAELK